MDRPRGAGVRQRPARPLARRRDHSLETGLNHPAFAPLRPWFGQLKDPLQASPEQLSALADQAGIRVASGRPLRFVAPSGERGGYGDYEIRVFESGCVETRPGVLHDLFNAFAWLAFPKTKARLNALHARAIPLEAGRRGRLRDLLTVFDEGGAIVACEDPQLIGLVRELRWKELFWDCRDRLLRGMRLHVLGHAVLERALAPWAGITCKALFVPLTGNPDLHAAEWLAALPADATPRALPPLPVFGYPGWHPDGARAEFYADQRFFRPARSRAAG